MPRNAFHDLSLNPSILLALKEQGYREPTDIQREAIPDVLEGKDLLATAQTGTGKTAAFALPMLHVLHTNPPAGKKPLRALILTPTRELAIQIDESFRAYGRHLRLRTAVIVGGVPAAPQIRALRNCPDILVATPGRLLDLMQQGFVHLQRIKMLVLDEADRMLDMGFIHDVRSIVAKIPRERQTLLFSATLTNGVAQLAPDMLRNPSRVEVTPAASISSRIEQKVLFVEPMDKSKLLTLVLKSDDVERVLVFTRTKHRASRLSMQLSRNGIRADAIHGNKTQSARQKALAAFDRGRVKVLVATDIVARGIDVDGISHVINYEMPNEPENYVHRIGRTARAGATGTALSFCAAAEVLLLKEIQKLTRRPLVTIDDHPFHSGAASRLWENPIGDPEPAPKKSGPQFGRRRYSKSADWQSHSRRSRSKPGQKKKLEEGPVLVERMDPHILSAEGPWLIGIC